MLKLRDSSLHLTKTGKISRKPRKVPLPRDIVQCRKLSTIGCTQMEIATVLGMSMITFRRRLDDEPQFAAAYELGQIQQFVNLRTLQWRHARSASGTPMTIHLSKHLLGQHDKSLIMNMSVDDLDLLISELERRMSGDAAPTARIEDRSNGGEPNEVTPPASTTARKVTG